MVGPVVDCLQVCSPFPGKKAEDARPPKGEAQRYHSITYATCRVSRHMAGPGQAKRGRAGRESTFLMGCSRVNVQGGKEVLDMICNIYLCRICKGED